MRVRGRVGSPLVMSSNCSHLWLGQYRECGGTAGASLSQWPSNHEAAGLPPKGQSELLMLKMWNKDCAQARSKCTHATALGFPSYRRTSGLCSYLSSWLRRKYLKTDLDFRREKESTMCEKRYLKKRSKLKMVTLMHTWLKRQSQYVRTKHQNHTAGALSPTTVH